MNVRFWILANTAVEVGVHVGVGVVVGIVCIRSYIGYVDITSTSTSIRDLIVIVSTLRCHVPLV